MVVHVIEDGSDGTLEQPLLYLATGVLFSLVVVRLAGLLQRLQTANER